MEDDIEHKTKSGTVVQQNGNLKNNDTPDETEQKHSRNLTIPLISEFLTDYFAPFLMKMPVKVSVLVAYSIYLAIAIWGCTGLKEGLDVTTLAQDDSYLIHSHDAYDKHYRTVYGPIVSIAFTDSLDYTDSGTLSTIDDIVNNFKQNELFYSDEYALNSWLHRFQYFLSLSSRTIENNITDMAQFIAILRGEFLPQENFEVYQEDVVFNSGFTEITSSRLFMQGLGSDQTSQERKLLVASREMADASGLSVSVFSQYFIFLDQFDVILVNTLQNLGIAIGAILIVSLFFIPSVVAVLWVTLAAVSICTGVIGYMALWDISLDSISMIILVMCIGFSVDFAAHISYHFVICKDPDPNNKAKEALGQLGTPIFQGALSTVLGVLILAASKTYIYRTFFKLVFLVMVFGVFHSLFLLPVLLSWFGCKVCKSFSKVSPHAANNNEQPPIETKQNEIIILENVTEVDVTIL